MTKFKYVVFKVGNQYVVGKPGNKVLAKFNNQIDAAKYAEKLIEDDNWHVMNRD